MEALPPAPPPWIEIYQRKHLDGDTALTTFQGLLIDEMLVPRGALESSDPAALTDATIAFVNSMQEEALLLPGEFAQEALWSFFALDYVSQAAKGGHVQYFQNRGANDLALKLASFGLKSMIADPHLALFNQFMKLKRLEPKEARKAAAKAGFGSVEAAIRDFDRQLGELEQSEPLKARHKIWLKSLRKVRVVPDEEWRASIARIAQSNPLNASRRAERERVRAERIAADPASLAVRSLCEMAGLRPTGLRVEGMIPMREAWPEGPKASALCVQVTTDFGPRSALFFAAGGMFKTYRAVLIEPGQALPVADLTLSRQAYSAIVTATRAD